MVKNDLILRNPMRRLEQSADSILPEGGFGAVLARAGVGKTALMVQGGVKHPSVRTKCAAHQPQRSGQQGFPCGIVKGFADWPRPTTCNQIDRLWDDLLPHRFIMTFKVEGFSVPHA